MSHAAVRSHSTPELIARRCLNDSAVSGRSQANSRLSPGSTVDFIAAKLRKHYLGTSHLMDTSHRGLASPLASWHHGSLMNAFAELEQVLNPAEPIFTVEGAQRLVDMPTNPERIARMEELGEKADEDTLTCAERSEYEALIHSSKLMSVLRLKAGAFLQNLKAA